MRLATWNINSIRARQDRALGWLDARRPDVVCLQETKVEDGAFPIAAVEALGYTMALHGQRTYNGVAILARAPLIIEDPRTGFDDGEPEDVQARLLAATVGGLRIINAYVPNGQAPGSEKYAYKLGWMARLASYVRRSAAGGRSLALCGDFNVAPEDRDVHDPALWDEQIMCSTREREALRAITSGGELACALRHLRPEPGLYTWWDYRQLSFPRNKGLRIDHIFLSPAVLARVTEVAIDRDERKGKQPSDHAPVVAELRAAAV